MSIGNVTELSSPLRLREWFMTSVLAVGLTMLFFWPLWMGGGLVGGDTLTYFYPQKQFLAEQLQAGHFPLWNNRSGFGYPLVAESQTGVFYPPNLLLYRFLNFESAYIASQLAHYVLGFLFSWLYCRRIGVSCLAAWFAALVYVYGWFPPRLCLEWAIVGGCFLPGVLWLAEGWLQQGRRRCLIAAAFCLSLQMLSGHFHLAFMTQLVLITYVPMRLFWATEGVHETVAGRRLATMLQLVATIVLALCLASTQLLPTWELKQQSQRQTSVSSDFDPAYGSIPPLYLSQVIGSWFYWYSAEINRDISLSQMSKVAGTNQVEAHLYFGLIPIGLVTLMLCWSRLRRITMDRLGWLWLGLGLCSVIYATGYLVPWARYLPGFGFFRGPGRYGLVTTLAVAVLSARCFHTFALELRPRAQIIFGLVVLALTTWDLWLVPQTVTYATMTHTRVTDGLELSAVRKLLQAAPQPVRLYAPGPNLTNLLGSASVPEYLGLGPAEYYAPDTKAPPLTKLTPEFLEWAEQSGITHILAFQPLSQVDASDRWRLIRMDPDLFLNRAWGKSFNEPVILYELNQSRGRIWTTDRQSHVLQSSLRSPSASANEVRIDVEASKPTTVVLTDLLYPGWVVTVDGQPTLSVRHAKQFRAVEVPAGRHEVVWRFQPTSVKLGVLISFAAALMALVAFWKWRMVPQQQR